MKTDKGCPLCGGPVMYGCHPMNRRMDVPPHPPLIKEDWREIMWFMKFVYLPFIHRVVARAIERERTASHVESEG